MDTLSVSYGHAPCASSLRLDKIGAMAGARLTLLERLGRGPALQALIYHVSHGASAGAREPPRGSRAGAVGAGEQPLRAGRVSACAVLETIFTARRLLPESPLSWGCVREGWGPTGRDSRSHNRSCLGRPVERGAEVKGVMGSKGILFSLDTRLSPCQVSQQDSSKIQRKVTPPRGLRAFFSPFAAPLYGREDARPRQL